MTQKDHRDDFCDSLSGKKLIFRSLTGYQQRDTLGYKTFSHIICSIHLQPTWVNPTGSRAGQPPTTMKPGLRAVLAIVAFAILLSDIRTVTSNGEFATSRQFRTSANGNRVLDAKSGLSQARSEDNARAVHSATPPAFKTVSCVAG